MLSGDGDRSGESARDRLRDGGPHAGQPGHRRPADGDHRETAETGIDLPFRSRQSVHLSNVASCSVPMASCSRSVVPASVGTTPSPKASSPRSRPSSSTVPHSRREARCGARSSSSSKCSTIAIGCTPRSVTAPRWSTRQRCFHARGSPRRPKQSVRQAGVSPVEGRKRSASSLQA